MLQLLKLFEAALPGCDWSRRCVSTALLCQLKARHMLGQRRGNIDDHGEPVPPTLDTVFEFPQRVIHLAEAMEPIAQSARRALARKVIQSKCEFELPEGCQQHIDVILHALSHLQARVDGLMTNVIQNEKAGTLDAGRAAGRLEQVLSELVDGYLDAKACVAVGDANRARSLVLAVYRHHILAICKWLDVLVKAIRLPAAAVREHQHKNVGGGITVTVVLKMSSPPEMAQLESLAEQLVRNGNVQMPHCTNSRLGQARGILDRIYALAFGLGITQATLARQHE